MGISHEASWANAEGKCVTFSFKGLRDLNLIHDDLEQGAELIYSEDIAVDEAAIQKWVTPKEELGVFRPTAPSVRPDYRSSDIVEKISKEFPHLHLDDDPQSSK